MTTKEYMDSRRDHYKSLDDLVEVMLRTANCGKVIFGSFKRRHPYLKLLTITFNAFRVKKGIENGEIELRPLTYHYIHMMPNDILKNITHTDKCVFFNDYIHWN